MKIRIGTRGSKLALTQTEFVRNRLVEAYPELETEIVIISTKGDEITNRPLHRIEGKGLFVERIEDALQRGEIDMAVHSMKDMPSAVPSCLTLTKSWKREDPRDVLILNPERDVVMESETPKRIATGSLRRAMQLKKAFPGVEIVPIRGNVDTRIRKMKEQCLDGLVLAAAGLRRLGREQEISRYLDLKEMVSAPAQGILALECRRNDNELIEMLDALSDEETDLCGQAERRFLQIMGGGCHVPVGAYCRKNGDLLEMHVVYCDPGDEDLGDDLNAVDGGYLEAYVSGSDPEETARAAAHALSQQCAGRVYLVGAGPGDDDLITVKGMNLLKEADCVIYDRLSAPRLLTLCRFDACLIDAGKRNHHHTMPQHEINNLLVRMGLRYKKTVRLKGGDPYLFGRGGEEALRLEEAGVPFEVVPGVTSAIAVPCYAGIPVTHRDFTSGVHIITAHRRDGGSGIDYKNLAESRETLVFLMGLTETEHIAEGLLKNGMRPDMPSAAISKGASTAQRKIVTTLAELSADVKAGNLESPAIILVGEVAALSHKLDHYASMPFFGRSYLVARIGETETALSRTLREMGADVCEVTVGNIRYRADAAEKAKRDAADAAAVRTYSIKEALADSDWAAFTSVHGVEGFRNTMESAGLDARALGHVKVAAIGASTANALAQYSIKADVVPEHFTGEALGAEMKAYLQPDSRVLYPCAAKTSGSLEKALAGSCVLNRMCVYENEEAPISADDAAFCRKYDAILLSSGSSAARLLNGCGRKVSELLKENGIVLCIGPACGKVYSTNTYADVPCRISDQADYNGMIETLKALMASCD